MKSSPSSSESRFNRISPFMKPSFKANAPVNPVSSSTVNRHSNGPCSMVSSARIASSVATPIPLSAPSVVPLAFIHSPSISVSIGSTRKSCSTSLFFSQTISTCDCKMTVCRFSFPGVAGFLIKTFPASSTLVSRLCFSPNAFKYAIIFSSFFEGRGTWHISAKYLNTPAGLSSCFSILFSFYLSECLKYNPLLLKMVKINLLSEPVSLFL